MSYFIYQRISTEKQSLIRQEGTIADYCKTNNIVVPEENVYSDIITGKVIKRENYRLMKSKLQKNDILIMLDLDRLGRNWDLIKAEWKDLTDKGIYIIIINCPLINVLPEDDGKISIDKRLIQSVMFELLCYLAQKEVEKVSKRTKETLAAKREAGVILGRPTNLTATDKDGIIQDRKDGMRVCDIITKYNTNKATVNKILTEAGLVKKKSK